MKFTDTLQKKLKFGQLHLKDFFVRTVLDQLRCCDIMSRRIYLHDRFWSSVIGVSLYLKNDQGSDSSDKREDFSSKSCGFEFCFGNMNNYDSCMHMYGLSVCMVMCMQILNKLSPPGSSVSYSTELLPMSGLAALPHVDLSLQVKMTQALFNLSLFSSVPGKFQMIIPLPNVYFQNLKVHIWQLIAVGMVTVI